MLLVRRHLICSNAGKDAQFLVASRQTTSTGSIGTRRADNSLVNGIGIRLQTQLSCDTVSANLDHYSFRYNFPGNEIWLALLYSANWQVVLQVVPEEE